MICKVQTGCSLKATLHKPEGKYDIAVQYFDTWRGASKYELLIEGKPVASWSANDTLPPVQFDANLDGQTSTRFTAHDVQLEPGGEIELRAVPDLRLELNGTRERTAPGELSSESNTMRDYREFAPVDYIEIGPAGPVTPQ